MGFNIRDCGFGERVARKDCKSQKNNFFLFDSAVLNSQNFQKKKKFSSKFPRESQVRLKIFEFGKIPGQSAMFCR